MARWHSLLGVPPAGLRGLQNSSSNDLAVHFQLANILRCLAGPIVCLVHTDHVSWIKGQIPGIGLACRTQFWEGARVNSTLKIQTQEAITLIEKIKAELKKRAELKAKRMLLRVPKRPAKR
jgi:hypothetical protein